MISAYFDLFRASAAAAAEPVSEEIHDRHDEGTDFTTVAYHLNAPTVLPWNEVKAIGAFPIVSKQPS